MNIGGKTTNPGELRTPVILHKRAIPANAGGFQVVTLGDEIARVYAKWANAHGAEGWSADAANGYRLATVTIRYLADLDETCLIVMSGVTWEIVSMDNIQQRNEYLEIKVKARVAA